MSTSVREADFEVEAIGVVVTAHHLTVDLADGRTISVPLSWYPRLANGTPAERAGFDIGPFGVHWPDLDEEISIKGLILGRRSGESAKSFARWLEYRARGEKVPVLTLPLPPDAADELQKIRVNE